MAVTNVRTWTNVTLPPAPAEYFLPDASGIAVPAGKTSWSLSIDQSNVPVGQKYGFWIEFQVDGQWLGDAGSDEFVGGPISGLHGAGSTPFNFVRSTIGDPTRPRSYPSNVRVRVTRMSNAWVFPTITLNMG